MQISRRTVRTRYRLVESIASSRAGWSALDAVALALDAVALPFVAVGGLPLTTDEMSNVKVVVQ
jgi:hypothetical protein